MDLNRILRIAVLSQWGFIILTTVIGIVEDSYLPPELATYVKNRDTAGLSALQKTAAVMMWAFMMSYLVSSLGLLSKKKWAPITYLYSVIFLTILTSFLAPLIVTPLTSLLSTAADIIIGITVCLVYFSPLKEEFKHTELLRDT
jgi:hypothetical protein